MLSAAQQSGVAIAMVTRSPMLLRLANRAVTIKDGRIVDDEMPQRGTVQATAPRPEAYRENLAHEELAS